MPGGERSERAETAKEKKKMSPDRRGMQAGAQWGREKSTHQRNE